MSRVNICDVCDKNVSSYAAIKVYKWQEFKRRKHTTDICFECWYKFEEFVAQKPSPSIGGGSGGRAGCHHVGTSGVGRNMIGEKL
jgi:hypothetical protein